MAGQPFRFVRACAAKVAAYVGGSGEPVFDEETKRLHIVDGATPGGSALAPERQDEGRLNDEYRTLAAAKAFRIPSDQQRVTVSGAVVENVGRANYRRSPTTGPGAGRWRNDHDEQWWEIIPIGLSREQLGALPGISEAISPPSGPPRS